MPYLGNNYSEEETLNSLKQFERYVDFEYLKDDWTNSAANALKDNKIIGNFDGNIEFGPRALGNRAF